MGPNDPKPYDDADLAHVVSMEYSREDNKGDRFYSYPTRNDNRPALATPAKQEYFYRAMKRAEAVAWLTPGRPAVPDPGGHHPWASYRNYSLTYLTRANQYTHLIEVHAPGFVEWMMEVGFTGGKIENNDISWGIGGNSSNSFGGNPKTNAALKALYAKACNNGVVVNHTGVPGGLRGMAKRVAPYIFKQSIKWVKLVNLRSQAP
ncbi:hypothetical protein WMF27_42155 [Sorangium sp. So ce281]|uniref:hypothetical protein n=1 Tax=unclassified Sorangium TaxID=2621164 RepID=UPI003F647807